MNQNQLAWNYIEARPISIPTQANAQFKSSTSALNSLGERLERLGKAAQAEKDNRANLAQLQAIARVQDMQRQSLADPLPVESQGLANRNVNVPTVSQGNGLSRVPAQQTQTPAMKASVVPVKAAEPYMDMFRSASKQYNVPLPILLAVAQTESGFNPNAVSQTGVKGLMQVTQDTYNGLGFTGDRANPANSINAGAKLLGQLHGKYGNWDDAFTAYNGGGAGVSGIRAGDWGIWANNASKIREITGYAPKVNNYLKAWQGVIDG